MGTAAARGSADRLAVSETSASAYGGAAGDVDERDGSLGARVEGGLARVDLERIARGADVAAVGDQLDVAT